MVDTRFHPSIAPVALNALLAGLPTPPAVADRRIATLAVAGAEELDIAGPAHVALAAQPSYRAALMQTGAGAVVVHPSLRSLVPEGAIAIVHDRAHELFVDILEYLYPGTELSAAPPLLEEGVRIGANAVIAPGVEIGRNTVIGANTTIGPGVSIGRNCIIGPNVSIEYAHLGNNVVLLAGARIGTAGFGWLDHGRRNRRIPQLGRVIVQDGVEIGANSTIDRGALGDTVIGEGTKIDNLVQVGHNSRIGRRCLIAGHCGISGSTVLEDSVLMGGGSSTAGHLTVGRGTVVLGAAGVTKDVPPGSVVGGFPAQDVRQWRRGVAALRRLARGDKSGHEI